MIRREIGRIATIVPKYETKLAFPKIPLANVPSKTLHVQVACGGWPGGATIHLPARNKSRVPRKDDSLCDAHFIAAEGVHHPGVFFRLPSAHKILSPKVVHLLLLLEGVGWGAKACG